MWNCYDLGEYLNTIILKLSSSAISYCVQLHQATLACWRIDIIKVVYKWNQMIEEKCKISHHDNYFSTFSQGNTYKRTTLCKNNRKHPKMQMLTVDIC